jgi:hypothetical protein
VSDNGSLFIATDESIGVVGDWLSGALGLEVLGGEPGHEVRLRGRAVGDGAWVGFVVRVNGHVEADQLPGNVQAMDSYPVEVDVRYGGEEALWREVRVSFEKVVAARPELPVLLIHNLALLIAAYLPGAGIKYFDAGTTPDGPDLAVWEPWVVR